MVPSSLIADLFVPSAGDADPEKIAGPDTLAAVATAVVTRLGDLNAPQLTEAELVATQGNGFVGQRRLSGAYQRFLAVRPDYAEVTGIDPVVYQQVIDKDDAYDGLRHVFDLLRQNIADGLLLLSGSASMQLKTVLDYVSHRLADPRLTEKEKWALRSAFGSIIEELLGLRQKLQARDQRQARVVGAAQQKIAAQRALAVQEADINALDAAARHEVNPALPAAPKKGHGKPKAGTGNKNTSH